MSGRRDRRLHRRPLVTVFKKQWSPFTAPLYAVLEGLFLGAVSAMFELRFPGIVIQAVGLTFGTLAALLLAYRSGLIKATENLGSAWSPPPAASPCFYLVQIGLQLFGFCWHGLHPRQQPARHRLLRLRGGDRRAEPGAGFRLHQSTASSRARRSIMEWYAAFGLLVTLVWLYLEILCLLSKLQSRN